MRHWYWYTGTDSGTKTSTLVLDKSDKLRCGPDTITLVLVLNTLLHYAALTLDQLLDKKNCRMTLRFNALGHNSLGRRTCVFGSMVTSQRILQEYIPLKYCARVHYCNPGRPIG